MFCCTDAKKELRRELIKTWFTLKRNIIKESESNVEPCNSQGSMLFLGTKLDSTRAH